MTIFRLRSFGAWAAAAVLAAFVLVGCAGGDGGPRVTVGDETLTAEPTSTATATVTATQPTDGSSTATPVMATPEAPSTATSTPSPVPTSPATPPADPGGASDLEGFPYSTSDVRAVVRALNLVFLPVDGLNPLCPGTSVAEVPVWIAHDGGTDFGPVFVLWVYPDEDALLQDWSTGPDGIEPNGISCTLPTGYVYWNANTVFAFRTWLSAGQDVGPYDPDRDPRDHPAVEAFLGMTP